MSRNGPFVERVTGTHNADSAAMSSPDVVDPTRCTDHGS